jgi:hypothetical protein
MPLATHAEQIEYQRLWIARRRSEWFQANGPCKRCGSPDHLELHHIDRLTKVTHNVWSWRIEKREAELAKCIILCRDCHQIETRKQFEKPITHGIRAGYDKGCRCEVCCAAKRETIRAWRIKVGGRKAPPKILLDGPKT